MELYSFSSRGRAGKSNAVGIFMAPLSKLTKRASTSLSNDTSQSAVCSLSLPPSMLFQTPQNTGTGASRASWKRLGRTVMNIPSITKGRNSGTKARLQYCYSTWIKALCLYTVDVTTPTSRPRKTTDLLSIRAWKTLTMSSTRITLNKHGPHHWRICWSSPPACMCYTYGFVVLFWSNFNSKQRVTKNQALKSEVGFTAPGWHSLRMILLQ